MFWLKRTALGTYLGAVPALDASLGTSEHQPRISGSEQAAVCKGVEHASVRFNDKYNDMGFEHAHWDEADMLSAMQVLVVFPNHIPCFTLPVSQTVCDTHN